jgi:hypothetical protein
MVSDTELRMHACRSLHPDVAQMAVDDDGLLPTWLIYHELTHASSKVMLRKVCAVEAAWVSPTLLKLRDMRLDRLAKSGRPPAASVVVEGGEGKGGAASGALLVPVIPVSVLGRKVFVLVVVLLHFYAAEYECC